MSGRKKSLSSRLSRRAPDEQEFSEAMEELFHSSDRVAAIMCSALVEHELMTAISARLHDPGDVSALFHSGEASPFGTFKQRIVAGKALGIYRAETAADLDLIRDIRNQFAHALLRIDFENEHIAATCSELREYLTWEPVEGREPKPVREKFENVCISIAYGLMRRTANAHREKAYHALVAAGLPIPSDLNYLIAPGVKRAYEDVIDEMLANKF